MTLIVATAVHDEAVTVAPDLRTPEVAHPNRDAGTVGGNRKPLMGKGVDENIDSHIGDKAWLREDLVGLKELIDMLAAACQRTHVLTPDKADFHMWPDRLKDPG